MEENRSFNDLMARLQAGSDSAASSVFHRYGQRLIGLARSRLDARIRRKMDPEDVVQSVFRSFFIRQADGEYDLEKWDHLWSLLVSVTIHKCLNSNQHFRAGRRAINVEVCATPAASAAAAGWDFIDRQPTPDEAAVLTETMQEAIRGLNDVDRTIIEMLLQGYLHSEISSQTAVSVATIKRVIARVRKRLQRSLAMEKQV